MAELGIYLISLGLVVMGATALIMALTIPGRIRSLIACLAALVPAVAGGYLFHEAGLEIRNLKPILNAAKADLESFMQGVQKAQSLGSAIEELKIKE